ncbi:MULTISPECIES: hypothetical protein [Streptomyces]|uniref:Uncharacterized protein n=2 Tax=Streptomyces TaxID=1883 RepID=A0ABV9IPZ9_9ACTN
MTKRTLTHGQPDAMADDIRDHQYAILQTRVERVRRLRRGILCQDPDGCTKPATLATFAVEEVVIDGDDTGFVLAKTEDGIPKGVVSCDAHRCAATHELYYALTERLRPDGINAHDVLGQHLNWH